MSAVDPAIPQTRHAGEWAQHHREDTGQEHLAASEQERRARIVWSHVAEPEDPVALLARAVRGPVGALTMLEEATPAEALAALTPEVSRCGTGGGIPDEASPWAPGRGTYAADLRRVDAALERWRVRHAALDLPAVVSLAARRGLRVLIPGDLAWPDSMADLGVTAPHCLWVAGPGRLPGSSAQAPAIAFVGSRASTAYGEDAASSLAAGIAGRGGCVVSGGAYGIDAAAHRGALAAGAGSTVAVLAGGLDLLYPRGNTRLLEAIGTRHALVSEAPPGTAPTRWRFLARNRLIAALAQVTVVVEASWRSGALSTARHADDLSRPVGAVPGPITSAASAGCHRLIRDRGAVLVTEVTHVLDLVRGGAAAGEGQSEHARQDELDLLSSSDRRVLDGIPPRSGIDVERLAVLCAVPESTVRAGIARLELLGLVHTMGDRVGRARERR